MIKYSIIHLVVPTMWHILWLVIVQVYNRSSKFNFYGVLKLYIWYIIWICFKLVILVLGGKASVMDLYSSLQGYREWEGDRERERERGQ